MARLEQWRNRVETTIRAHGKSTRRKFIRDSSLLVAAGAVANHLQAANAAHPFGDETIRIGLIGCGGRGTGAAAQAMNTEGPTKLVAVADAFSNRIAQCVRALQRDHANKLDVPEERQFVGFDGYKHVLESDVDLVILATPPGFRPLHFEAAVNADKHVFMEKPVAVDPAGVRRVLASTAEAKRRNLAVAVGLQRHHEQRYIETMNRLHEGIIGDIVCSRVYWNGGGVWVRERTEDQTEMEYQMRNWYYFNWLCGDHINEQHIHNLDVGNWLKRDYPVRANAIGGREVRKGKDHGQIFDHHSVEYTYADGSKMFSQCRHIPNCWNAVSEHAHGTNGSCNISGARIYDAAGNESWSFGQGGGGGHQEEHHHLLTALRCGEMPNEGEYGAMSTMTAILGRLASYSGKVVTMDDAMASCLVESPVDNFTSFDDTPPVVPDINGNYPLPIPGSTQVIQLPEDEKAAKAAVRNLIGRTKV